jgi:hypothetical protein
MYNRIFIQLSFIPPLVLTLAKHMSQIQTNNKKGQSHTQSANPKETYKIDTNCGDVRFSVCIIGKSKE